MPYDWSDLKQKWEHLIDMTSCSAEKGCNMGSMSVSDGHLFADGHLRDAFLSKGQEAPHIDEHNPDPHGTAQEIYDLVKMFFDLAEDPEHSWHPHRDELSHLALDMSLCPMHLVDYAICFDDEDEECDQIRAMFPQHDT